MCRSIGRQVLVIRGPSPEYSRAGLRVWRSPVCDAIVLSRFWLNYDNHLQITMLLLRSFSSAVGLLHFAVRSYTEYMRDERHCIRHTTSQNIDCGDFIREGGTSCGDHLEITCDSALVTPDGKVERTLRGDYCVILRLASFSRIRTAARLSSTCWNPVSTFSR